MYLLFVILSVNKGSFIFLFAVITKMEKIYKTYYCLEKMILHPGTVRVLGFRIEKLSFKSLLIKQMALLFVEEI